MKSYNHDSDYQESPSLHNFFVHVFGWMGLGLATTTVTAWYIFYHQPELLTYLVQSPFLLIGIFMLQLGLVFWISSSVLNMPFSLALPTFLFYAMLNGITFSGIFFTYTQESLVATFAIAAAMFFVMALVGYFTRIDLTPIRIFGSMLLIGLISAMVINWFVASNLLEMIISAVGVLLFSALTAYDLQQLRMYATQLTYNKNKDLRYHVALLGALKLYLDFINIVIMLLSFTGKRRN